MAYTGYPKAANDVPALITRTEYTPHNGATQTSFANKVTSTSTHLGNATHWQAITRYRDGSAAHSNIGGRANVRMNVDAIGRLARWGQVFNYHIPKSIHAILQYPAASLIAAEITN